MNKIEVHYVGACALLGRLAEKTRDADERYCIKKAMDDCASLLGYEVIGNNRYGWSLQPILPTDIAS